MLDKWLTLSGVDGRLYSDKSNQRPLQTGGPGMYGRQFPSTLNSHTTGARKRYLQLTTMQVP